MSDVPQSPAPRFGSTRKKDEARSSITRNMVTPAPGEQGDVAAVISSKPSLWARFDRSQHGELTAARVPYPGCSVLRLIISILLSVLCLLAVGGAILVLLLWQQERSAGVLSSQLDRTWEWFDVLRRTERVVVFAVVPIATAWVALSTVNVFRATGKRRSPIVAAASLPLGLLGVWAAGARVVAESDDVAGKASGFVLQAVFLAIPLLALERVAHAGDARHGPLRASYLISLVYLAHLQFLGALSTVEQSTAAEDWGRLASYLLIGGLLQVLGALAINEAARAIEDGTENRFQLRQRFSESLLAQVGLT